MSNMAARIFKLLSADSVSSMQVRFRYSRGKRPGVARTLEQRITEMEYQDPALYYKVNIGFALGKKSTSSEMRQQRLKEIKARRNDPELAKKASSNQLTIDLEKVREEWWQGNGPKQVHDIAKHQGIYNDLYGDGYFYPVLPLDIEYDFGHEELLAKVHRGNLLKSQQVQNAPSITYKADPKSLWTLLLTTPDGNYSDSEKEYCHWFIGNIPGNDVAKGEQIIDYLRPIPAKGLGFCRYVFVLYKQDKEIDFTEYKKEQPCLNLVDRNWKTYDFMRKHEDYITPAGLAFFQSEYDSSLKDFYWNTLKMEEPEFEYDFPEPYMRPAVWFPKRQPFNVYMDRYRDKKQINKEFLLKKLKKEHPFKFPDPPLKYPNAHPFVGYQPSWWRTEATKERIGQGRINNYK